jgi:hypothetical protein
MLGKPVFEVMFGSYVVPMPLGYLESNHVVTGLSQLESLLRRYLETPGVAIPEFQRRSRNDFLRRAYYRIDGKASERCAALLHELAVEAVHSGTDQLRIRAACASAYDVWQKTSAARFSNRLKALLGVPRETSLRFWKPSFWRFEDRPQQGDAWDESVTPEMVQPLFDQFDRAQTPRTIAGEAVNAIADISHSW